MVTRQAAQFRLELARHNRRCLVCNDAENSIQPSVRSMRPCEYRNINIVNTDYSVLRLVKSRTLYRLVNDSFKRMKHFQSVVDYREISVIFICYLACIDSLVQLYNSAYRCTYTASFPHSALYCRTFHKETAVTIMSREDRLRKLTVL